MDMTSYFLGKQSGNKTIAGTDLNILKDLNENAGENDLYNAPAINKIIEETKEITTITEDTYVYELESGIYKIDGYEDGYQIILDDGWTCALQEGLLIVSKSQHQDFYDWISIGFDMNGGNTTIIGTTYKDFSRNSWVIYNKTDILFDLERYSNRKNTLDNPRHDSYPSTKAVVDYVQEQLKNVGGGSGVDLVTEFEGTDKNYEENKVYNANVVNDVLNGVAGLFETKQDLLQDGENIKTINGESILGAGDISIGGGSGEEWEELVNVTLEEEAIPILDIGDYTANFKKLRYVITVNSKTPVSTNFVMAMGVEPLSSAYTIASIGSFGNESGKAIAFIEFEPLIAEGFCRSSVAWATPPCLSTKTGSTAYQYNSYDYTRLLTARYFRTSTTLPAGTSIVIKGVRI